MVEQRSPKPRVLGSSPSAPAKADNICCLLFLFVLDLFPCLKYVKLKKEFVKS